MTKNEKESAQLKAHQLINEFHGILLQNKHYQSYYAAIECALRAVNEILEITSESYDINHISWWKDVKDEIEQEKTICKMCNP